LTEDAKNLGAEGERMVSRKCQSIKAALDYLKAVLKFR